MKLLAFLDHALEYLFSALFFFTPLALSSDTFELFEFNKMWLVFALTILIALVWIMKMILKRELAIPKTPLDIPIILFLASQIISTIFSLDQHVSLWGYYSRFNGGLLSTISYIILYYALMSIASPTFVKKSLIVILLSGAVVALWGLPSHFGYDPTCLLFRGSLDVSCWTDAFQPKIRMFSTLGQPAWFAAYLSALAPLALAFCINSIEKSKKKAFLWFALATLFYLDLLYTSTRSGFAGMLIGLFIFAAGVFYSNKEQLMHEIKKQQITSSTTVGCFLILVILMTFAQGTPFTQFNRFTLPGIRERMQPPTVQTKKEQAAPVAVGELGGTDSGTIRKIVWTGAIDAWQHYSIFGSGAETFSIAYYLYRPAAHNMTSEWDFLYNKAHNEYLNYLATTGIVGLGTYLAIIITFLVCSMKYIVWSKILNTKYQILILSLLSGYVSILITNFFGFSVVIINVFFFLFPAFIFAMQGSGTYHIFFKSKKNVDPDIRTLPLIQTVLLVVVMGVAVYCETILLRYWMADKSYALGYNLDRANEYQTGHQKLADAILLRSDEPTFQDELSVNTGILATAYAEQKDATTAAELIHAATTISDYVVSAHPNNVTFWKTRVRLFYTLSQVDDKYLPKAVEAIEKANVLAPTDAKISYNLGLLYGEDNQTKKAVDVLQKTIQLKPDYRDAYYALGLYYRELAIDKKGVIVNPDFQKKAEEQMQNILTHFDKNDKQAKEALTSWKK